MYGDANNVAAKCSMWTNTSGLFDETTAPKKSQVENWIEQLSSVADLALRQYGFTSTPVTDPTAIGMLSFLIEGLAADLVHDSHRTGRFYSERAIKIGKNVQMTIGSEILAWVGGNVEGLVILDLEREEIAEGIGFKDTNEAGDELFPIFHREAFDNVFENWDTAN